ncbi:MAG: DUF4388 domain-containing protein [Proteobacteria bacterium]|nr:DUF4388 domain-containing protein [Pseudomonadota bacterium]
MKLLAVVEDNLKNILLHSLGCEIDFRSSWREVPASALSGYTALIASGSIIEDPFAPIVFWGIASEIRYFSLQAVLVDVSGDGCSLIARVYPQIKLASYGGDEQQLISQLRACLPMIFHDMPAFAANASSSAFNVRRVEERPKTTLTQMDLSGPRQSIPEIPAPPIAQLPGSFGAITSIPLGVHSSRFEPAQRYTQENSVSAPSFRKEGMGIGRSAGVMQSDLELDDNISSVSSISGISGIMDATSDSNNPQPKQGEKKQSSGIKAKAKAARLSDETIGIRRYAKDFQIGNVEFGTIIHVVQTIIRLALTGTLEIQNTTRVVKIEFREGRVFSAAAVGLIQSALAWTQGEFTFNSNRMLSSNAQPVDVHKLFHVAADQFPINAVLRALEQNFNQYIKVTNQFRPEHYDQTVALKWWKSCDGMTRLSDIIMKAGAELDLISREIFLAYLCDEVHFFDTQMEMSVRIQYDEDTSAKSQSGHSSLSRALNELSQENSQINVIREDLLEVRERFNHEDGYAILGLSAGCGTKALDAAYYAWINRYHTDRFVRFKNPEFIKLANEILMLMNAAYTKLSKAEQRKETREKALEAIAHPNNNTETPKVSERIGMGRARIQTVNPTNALDNEQLRNLSSELRSLQNSQNAPANPPRVPVRPASVPPEGRSRPQNHTVPRPRTSSSGVVKMSEVLQRRQSSQTVSSIKPNADPRPSSPKLPAQPWASSSVTPEQHFQTAKKKLTLGLAQEAYVALGWALEAQPDNIDYILYHAYAAYLVDVSKREECIERILNSLDDLKRNLSNPLTPEEKSQLFAANYFLGKIYISVENYDEAAKYIEAANKYNPNDIDTQRCMRYINMQQEKKSPPDSGKGLFSKLKDRLNKPL